MFKGKKDKDYLEKKAKLTDYKRHYLELHIEKGICNKKGMSDDLKIGNIIYVEEKEKNDKQKKYSVRNLRKNVIKIFLGENEISGACRQRELIKYMIINDPATVHPKLRKIHKKMYEIDLENAGEPLESNSYYRLPLKARTKNRKPVRVQDFLCEKLLFSDTGLIRIKGSSNSGKSTEINAFAQICKVRGIELIKIDFKNINNIIAENASKLMNWFIKQIYKQMNFEDNNESYRNRIINEDPNGGSYECIKDVMDKMSNNLAEDKFLLIIMEDVDRLFDYPDAGTIFFQYARRVFQELKKIKQIITYSTYCYLKLDDYKSVFNVGILLTLCGLDLEDKKRMLDLYEIKSPEEINSLYDWIGGNPYLWQKAIPYFKEPEFEVEDFKNKILENYDVRAFLCRICEVIKEDEQLLNIINVLLDPGAFIEETEPKIRDILEGLGVIKKDLNDRDKWIISCEMYRVFLKKNFPEKKKENSKKIIKNFIYILNNF